MIIARQGDRIPVQIGDATFFFGPVLMQTKMALLGALPQNEADRKPDDMMQFARAVLATTLKGVEGLYNADGSAYEVKFSGDQVAGEIIDDLMNCDFGTEIAVVAGTVLKGVPAEGQVINPQTKKPLEGVIVKKVIPGAAVAK